MMMNHAMMLMFLTWVVMSVDPASIENANIGDEKP